MNYATANELFEVTYDGDVINKYTRHYNALEGVIAGSVDRYGYRQICYKGKFYFAHNISWLLTFKEWPKLHLDHMDGNVKNNAVTNLRPSTRSQNQHNAKKRIDNTVGVKGISWRKDLNMYVARVQTNGSRKYIGVYKNLSEAEAAIKEYRVAAHGEFANHGS